MTGQTHAAAGLFAGAFRPPALRVHVDGLVVDNFAGGGGASLGIEWALGRSPDIAVNHDPEAVAMHRANHPDTQHHCESVWKVDPVKVCAGRPVALAWFSPDCTFHSKARGAKPFRDPRSAKGRRGLAWVVTRWARAVRPRVIVLENVEEFQDWGPLADDGRPCALRRGFTFRRWLAQLRNCGYEVDLRELRACDYGAPTSRKRLFIIARSDGLPIVWPEPTHGPRELFRAQGFPDTYVIDPIFNGKSLTKTAQVRMCGNSVCPPIAAAIVAANLGVAALEATA